MKFIKSATKKSEFPVHHKDEVAIVGRSNVGKSSLINHLFNNKNLAKVSQTPGKTRLINFFEANDFVLVDLPGYGFANVGQEERKSWSRFIQNYLTDNEKLKLILFLVDLRRKPSDDDFAMYEWIQSTQKNAILIMTKKDKLNQSELIKNSREILAALPFENHISYSVHDPKGKEQLFHMIKKGLG